jgi:hypothetical protein
VRPQGAGGESRHHRRRAQRPRTAVRTAELSSWSGARGRDTTITNRPHSSLFKAAHGPAHGDGAPSAEDVVQLATGPSRWRELCWARVGDRPGDRAVQPLT